MKNLFKCIFVSLIVSLISCKDRASVPKEAVNYKLVDSLLTATKRYWKIELVTRISGDDKLEYITRDEDGKIRFDKGVLTTNGGDNGILQTAFYFTRLNPSIDSLIRPIVAQVGSGPYGPVPYTSDGGFSLYHSPQWLGGWYWTSDHSKLMVNLPGPFPSVLKEVSGDEPFNYEIYLDPSSYPVYGNVEAIRAAAKSERIRVIMKPKNKDRSEYYVFTFRAIWLDSRPTGSSRYSLYDKVFY